MSCCGDLEPQLAARERIAWGGQSAERARHMSWYAGGARQPIPWLVQAVPELVPGPSRPKCHGSMPHFSSMHEVALMRKCALDSTLD